MRNVTRRGMIGLVGAGGVGVLASCLPGQIPIASDERGPFPDAFYSPIYSRSNITEGKPGVPLTVNLTFLNTNSNLVPLTNARIDIWQCDKDGIYSGYVNQGVNAVGKTFLRGIQVTNSKGVVQFKTIYPGWYPGRIAHQHIEIRHGGKLLKTTQLAFPDTITRLVYASPLYKSHGQNSSVIDNAHDHVFSDGTSTQLMSLTGNVNSGYVASLTAGILA